MLIVIERRDYWIARSSWAMTGILKKDRMNERRKEVAKPSKAGAAQTLSFQDLILKLEGLWADESCVILQPYDMEMGAATFHPATALRSLGPKPWRAAYVQPSRRPKD